MTNEDVADYENATILLLRSPKCLHEPEPALSRKPEAGDLCDPVSGRFSLISLGLGSGSRISGYVASTAP